MRLARVASVVVPIKVPPPALIRSLSIPTVDRARVLAPGDQKPVSVSPVKVYEGAPTVPKEAEIVPAVILPVLSEVENKLVEEATVAKLLVVVALPETKRLPETERAWLGVEEPMPRKPLASRVKAGVVEVAVPATVVVAK